MPQFVIKAFISLGFKKPLLDHIRVHPWFYLIPFSQDVTNPPEAFTGAHVESTPP
jgi:hypothetical protein